MSATSVKDDAESSDNSATPNLGPAAVTQGLHPDLANKPKTWSIGTLTYSKSSLIVLFCWLLWGDFAWSMKDRAVGPVFQILLTQYGASNMVMALLLNVIPSAIGLVLGPIISFRSDRYRSRLGRRVPFLLLTTPIAALAMAAIAFSPMLGTFTHHAMHGATAASGVEAATTQNQGWSLNSYILLYFGIFWVAFEIATIAANSVFGAFLNDVVPRNFLGRFFGLFRAVSLVAGMIFNFWLIKKAEEHYVWLFIAISSLYGIGFTAMCFRVKEGKYPPPPELPLEKRNRSLPVRFMEATKEYFQECYSKPYYLWLFFTFAIAGFTFGPVNTFSWPFAKSLGISVEVYGYYLALTYLISLALSYFLGSMADRFHPLRVGMIAMFLYAAGCVWGGIASTTVTPFAIAFVAHGVLSGTYFTATASLGQRLYPHEKFAQFASAGGIVGSLFSMLASFAFGWFLDITGSVYRYTFTAAGILGFISLALLYIVYRKFMALGGPKGYVAPE